MLGNDFEKYGMKNDVNMSCVSKIDSIVPKNELDKPIARMVEVKERTGMFSENPTIEGVRSWLKEVNPNYDPFDFSSPYIVNCGACAYVVHERLNGNDAVCASANNISTTGEMEKLLGRKIVSTTPEIIHDTLMEIGDGAHSVIGVDRSCGPGHWFNAACIEGKVVAIDGQSGEIKEWPPDYGDVVSWEMSI